MTMSDAQDAIQQRASNFQERAERRLSVIHVGALPRICEIIELAFLILVALLAEGPRSVASSFCEVIGSVAVGGGKECVEVVHSEHIYVLF